MELGFGLGQIGGRQAGGGVVGHELTQERRDAGARRCGEDRGIEPSGRQGAAAAELGGRIYVLGGRWADDLASAPVWAAGTASWIVMSFIL